MHFVGLAYIRCCRNASNTSRRCSRCSSSELEYTRMSSKYTRTNLSIYGRKIEFINVWNVAGAFVRPKGMTKLILPIPSVECRLWDVLLSNSELPVSRQKVD